MFYCASIEAGPGRQPGVIKKEIPMNSQQKLISTLVLTLGLCSWSATSLAQQDRGAHDHDNSSATRTDRGQGGMMSHGDGSGGGMMQRMRQRMGGDGQAAPTTGQSALDVISAVVRALQANPDTDWSQINIDALRQHLVDMDRVALYAQVEANEIEGGSRFRVSGNDARTITAIQRMVPAHALQVERESGWDITAQQRDDGIELSVQSSQSSDAAMIRALGFAGFMVLGEHHADHHLMMAGGQPDTTGMSNGGGQDRMMNRGGDGGGDQQGHNH
jgi:hypothetical protein